MTTGLGGMKPNIVLLGFFREGNTSDQLIAHRNEILRKSKKKVIAANSAAAAVEEVDQILNQLPSIDKARAAEPKLSCDDYVGIIEDALVLGKNVIVARNFERMPARRAYAKAATKAGDDHWYVDVWPIIPNTGDSHFSFELMCQLGAIVRMVRAVEKYARLRLVSIVDNQSEVDAEFARWVHVGCFFGAALQCIQSNPHMNLYIILAVTLDLASLVCVTGLGRQDSRHYHRSQIGSRYQNCTTGTATWGRRS